MIAIVNYFMGNLQSVANALEYLKTPCEITNEAGQIARADAIILPGVGTFSEAMANLNSLGLVPVLRERVMKEKTPFLGICLGMQLLAEKGYEGGECGGLGLLPGTVQKLTPDDAALRLPHVGWNDVTPVRGSRLYGDDLAPRAYYFVHSYHVVCADQKDVSGYAEYGGQFAASVERGNVFGTQFHPEKSQRDGLNLLERFIAVSNRH